MADQSQPKKSKFRQLMDAIKPQPDGGLTPQQQDALRAEARRRLKEAMKKRPNSGNQP